MSDSSELPSYLLTTSRASSLAPNHPFPRIHDSDLQKTWCCELRAPLGSKTPGMEASACFSVPHAEEVEGIGGPSQEHRRQGKVEKARGGGRPCCHTATLTVLGSFGQCCREGGQRLNIGGLPHSSPAKWVREREVGGGQDTHFRAGTASLTGIARMQ